jgi:hypothetical protein
MRIPFRLVKRVALVALLAISGTGLAISSQGVSTSHAATYLCFYCSPTISAQYTSSLGYTLGYITGRGFRPFHNELVYTFSPTGRLLSEVTTPSNAAGQITVTNFGYPACQSSYFVQVWDTAALNWSNSVTLYWIDCLT